MKHKKPRAGAQLQTGKALPPKITHYSYSRHPEAHRPPETEAEPKSSGSKAAKIIKRSLLLLAAVILAFVIIIGVWDARNISAASRKLFGSGDIFSLLGTQPLKADSNGRVNILITGYSVDDPDHPGATLTDSILLLSMDPAGRSGYLLSIPRDLYVDIPGFGYAKINEAYQDGGIGLLERVVQADFQIQPNYYAIVDYSAVRDVVDALGGITVNIQSSDPRGLYDGNISPVDSGPLKLSNGPQTLNGQTALNLTRARGDTTNSYGFPQSDFDRTQHQRQVFTAIKAKLNWKLILNPRQNGKILNAVADNVKTDIQAGQARRLFGLFNSIPDAKLQSLSLRDFSGQNYLSSYITPYGQDALVPAAGLNDYSQIDQAISQL